MGMKGLKRGNLPYDKERRLDGAPSEWHRQLDDQACHGRIQPLLKISSWAQYLLPVKQIVPFPAEGVCMRSKDYSYGDHGHHISVTISSFWAQDVILGLHVSYSLSLKRVKMALSKTSDHQIGSTRFVRFFQSIYLYLVRKSTWKHPYRLG